MPVFRLLTGPRVGRFEDPYLFDLRTSCLVLVEEKVALPDNQQSGNQKINKKNVKQLPIHQE